MSDDTPEKALEWHKANLKRERELLAFMEAACGSPEAAARNSLVISQRYKVATIERIIFGTNTHKPSGLIADSDAS
jgi:hypothetical protein